MLPQASGCLDGQTVLDLVSGALPTDRLRAVEGHIAQCASCQGLVAEIAASLDSTVGRTTDGSSSHRRNRTLGAGRQSVPRAADQSLPVAGDVLGGKYRVDGWLGRGGMGSVMRGTHLDLGQRVAIKILHTLDEDAVARFMREGRTLAQLHSQHIVRVYDSGRLHDATPFIVMEYLEGCDLAELLQSGTLEPHVAISFVRQACRALEVSHGAGIVHRDVKPSNLFVTRLPDGSALIKVLDFGVSKHIVREEYELSLTTTGTVIGSPRYMSPEQINASHRVDRAADIWALGIIMYELLTGRAPFEQTTITSLLIAIAAQRPAPLRQLRPTLPAELEAIVLRCLEKDPGDRFANVAELSAALARYETPFEDHTAKRRAPRAALMLFGLALCAVVAALGVRHWRDAPGDAVQTSVHAVTTTPGSAAHEHDVVVIEPMPVPAVVAGTSAIAPAAVIELSQPARPASAEPALPVVRTADKPVPVAPLPKREPLATPSAAKPVVQPAAARALPPTPVPKQLGPLDTPD
jgi:eukaryotic-like serine/threonine-protein kinase